MRVRVKVQPSGLLNGYPWPDVGETVDLPDAVAKEMADAGHVEAVKAPAKKKPAKKAAKKPEEKVETRPAPKDDVEARAE